MQRTRALFGRLGTARRLFAWNAAHGQAFAPDAWYPEARRVDETTFEDRVMGLDTPVLLDCWSARTHYEGVGQTAAVALAAGMANATKHVAAAYGEVTVRTLDVDANAGLAAHLEVANTPTLLIIFDGEVFGHVGCVADDVRADSAIHQAMRAASDVYDAMGYKATHPQYRVVSARKNMIAGDLGEARWGFQKALETALKPPAPNAVALPFAAIGGGVSTGEVIASKAGAGLVQCAFKQQDFEEVADVMEAVLRGAPRAAGALADVRRTLAAVNLALISMPDHTDGDGDAAAALPLQHACTLFLRGAYADALALIARADPSPLADAARLSMLAYVGYGSPLAAAHAPDAGVYDKAVAEWRGDGAVFNAAALEEIE